MNLIVIKAGILDTVQDGGRRGFQYLGINPGGVMDRWSAQVANILVGNAKNDPVIEMHFPSGEFFFEEAALIAISGADFSAHINGEEIPLHQPILINRYSILQFYSIKHGARIYLALHGGFAIFPWLDSYSTHLKAQSGGFNGKALQKGDEIGMKSLPKPLINLLGKTEFVILPWRAEYSSVISTDKKILVLEGNEWMRLTDTGREAFMQAGFLITPRSDRMGYRLKGDALSAHAGDEMVSSAVNCGTVQLLPDGQLIVLMADHQTTGGYPRIAHVITAHLPLVAQRKAGESLSFEFTDQITAEQMLYKQQQHLLQLQNACTFRLQEYIHEH